MSNNNLYNRILSASNEISKSARSGNGSYIILSSKILKSQFYRTDRISKLEKILRII